MKKGLKFFAILCGLIILVVGIALTWLMNTNSGLNLVLQQAAPMLEAERVEGTLNDLSFSKLRYLQDGTKVDVESGKLKWQLTSIFSRTITVEQLKLNDITVSLPTSNDTKETAPINGIELPANIVLSNIDISNLSIVNLDKSKTKINSIKLDAKLGRRTLDLKQLSLALDNAELNANGKLSLLFKDNLPVDLALNGFLQDSEQRYQFKNTLSGRWGKLKLNSVLFQPAMVNADVELSNPFKPSISWLAKVNIEQFDSRQYWQDSPFETLVGDIDSSGAIETAKGLAGLDATIKTNLTATDEQQQLWQIGGSANVQSDKNQLIFENLTVTEQLKESQNDKTKPLNFVAKGEVANFAQLVQPESSSKPQITLQGDWHQLRWPLVGSQQYASKQGNFSVEGSLENYQLNLVAAAESAAVKDAALNIVGDCSQNDCDFQQMKIDTEHGLLDGQAKLVWQPHLQWQSRLKLDKFNPALLLPEYDGELSALLVSNGQQSLKENAKFPYVGELVLSDLTGSLNKQALTGNVKLLANPDSLTIQNTKFELGKTSITVSGNIDQNYNLKWQLNTPNIGEVVANANGAVSFNGKLIGELSEPIISAEVLGSGIRSSELKLGKLQAKLDATLNREKILEQSLQSVNSINLDFKLNDLQQGAEEYIKHSSIKLVGSSAKHTLSGNTLSGEQSANFLLEGQVKENTWLAQLKKLTIGGKSDWSLKQATQLKWSKGVALIEPSCVTAEQQSICLSLNRDLQNTVAGLEIDNYQLSQFDQFTELYGFKLAGNSDVEFSYEQKSGNTEPRIKGYIKDNNAELIVLGDNHSQQPKHAKRYPIESLSIAISNQTPKQHLKLDADIKIDQFASLVGNLSGPSVNDVNGSFDLNVIDLSAIPSPLLEGVQLNGQLKSNLKVTGDLNKPNLAVNAVVRDAEARIIELGTHYRDIQLELISKAANTVDVNGSLLSGEGKLDFNGFLDFKNPAQARAELDLNANNFTLSNTKQIAAVGDLSAHLKMQDALMSIKGDLQLAAADINYQTSPSVVLASSDVELAANNQQQSKQQLELDFKVDLGDKTRFRAMGVDAQLDGDLRIEKEPEGIITGVGEIFLKQGAYVAYGQQLVLDKGSFIFSDNSISNPNLSLQASKKINQRLNGRSDYEAGLRVSGTAELPIIDLYSNPAMSDEDIMSVLIFGKPTSELGPESSIALLRIAASLRGDGSNKFTDMTESLRNDLGLTDLSFDFADGDPSLEAGKQFSKNFYVGYGYSLLNAAQSIIMRYRINQNWSLQGDMGETSGADIHYQIER